MQSKNVTVLFCDIRNFTQVSDKLDPAEVKKILDQSLSLIRTIVAKHNGTLIKFSGDGPLVVFGDKDDQKEHGLNAIRAALEIKNNFYTIKEKFDKKITENFDIGIGIHTGPVLIGDIGDSDYSEYTVIGSSVNLAARLQTYSLENNVVATEASTMPFSDMILTNKIDDVYLKDFDSKISLVEVLGLK